MTTTLREARREDIAAMRRVRLSVKENRLISREISDSDYLRAIEADGRGWVIEAQGEVVAFAVCNVNGTIWALFVHPAHEGRNYGRQLHDTMVNWLWSQGLREACLTTDPGTRAERFYQSAGWKYVGPTSEGECLYVIGNPTLVKDPSS